MEAKQSALCYSLRSSSEALLRAVMVQDGYVFDLGGRKLEVVESPGRTPREFLSLDAASKIILTGDNNNTMERLFMPNSELLEVCLESLKEKQKRIGNPRRRSGDAQMGLEPRRKGCRYSADWRAQGAVGAVAVAVRRGAGSAGGAS